MESLKKIRKFTYLFASLLLLVLFVHPLPLIALSLIYLLFGFFLFCFSSFIYLVSSSIFGGLIYVLSKRQAGWQVNEFHANETLLPANILLTNLFFVTVLYRYVAYVKTTGDSDPIWILGCFPLFGLISIFFGILGGFVLLPRALANFKENDEKIAFTNKIVKAAFLISIPAALAVYGWLCMTLFRS